MRHIALLRGINVGGRNRLPMKELAALFRTVGCDDVTTYIQSGNVVYTVDEDLAPRVSDAVSQAIAADYGYSVPVVTRTLEELAAVAENNPFLHRGVDPKELHVAFLAELPDPTRTASLDPDRSPPDEFVVSGREVYLRFPKGVAASKLTNQYFDSKLGTVSTARNWRTVSKILELAKS